MATVFLVTLGLTLTAAQEWTHRTVETNANTADGTLEPACGKPSQPACIDPVTNDMYYTDCFGRAFHTGDCVGDLDTPCLLSLGNGVCNYEFDCTEYGRDGGDCTADNVDLCIPYDSLFPGNDGFCSGVVDYEVDLDSTFGKKEAAHTTKWSLYGFRTAGEVDTFLKAITEPLLVIWLGTRRWWLRR
jgi:hypothetical protein